MTGWLLLAAMFTLLYVTFFFAWLSTKRLSMFYFFVSLFSLFWTLYAGIALIVYMFS